MFRFPTKTLGVAALSLLALTAAPAQAATIYQSISDLSAFPAQYGWCSTCDGSFAVYDGFSLSAGASINQIDFNVLSTYNFPSPVTIQIFKANAGQAGSEIFGQTYAPTSFTTGISPFLNVVDHGTNYTSTVSVDLAGLVSQGTNYFIDGSLGKLDSRGLSLDAITSNSITRPHWAFRVTIQRRIQPITSQLFPVTRPSAPTSQDKRLALRCMAQTTFPPCLYPLPCPCSAAV